MFHQKRKFEVIGLKKGIISIVLSVCFVLCLGGCGELQSILGGATSNEAASNGTIVTDASVLEDGREVGGYADGRMGDVLVNEFFSFCVNSAELADEYGGEAPQEGNLFLVAELTVKNVFGAPIPMWSDDFQVQWGEGEKDFGYPIGKVTDEQMEDEYEMARGDTLIALVVYEVPRLEGTNEYSISYKEVYEDEVEGSVFFIYFDLETPA